MRQNSPRRNKLSGSGDGSKLEERAMLAGSIAVGSQRLEAGKNSNDAKQIPGSGITDRVAYVVSDSDGQITQVLNEEQYKNRKQRGTLPKGIRETNRKRLVVKEGEDKQQKKVRDENGEKVSIKANGLDSRSEFKFDHQLRGDGIGLRESAETRPGKHTVTFRGYFDVKSAKDTTIFQILNSDPKVNERKNNEKRQVGKPQLFIEAETRKDDPKTRDVDESKLVYLYNAADANRDFETVGKGDDAERVDTPFYIGPKKFNLEVRTDGKSGEILVNGEVAQKRYNFDRDVNTEKVFDLPNDSNNQFRYGAYHHDRRVIPKDQRDPNTGVTLEAASTADITVFDAHLLV